MLSKIASCKKVKTVSKKQQKKIKGGGIITADLTMT